MLNIPHEERIKFNNVPNGFIRFRNSRLFVSENGLVWNAIRDCYVKGNVKENGYIMFSYFINGVKWTGGIHRLLAECYIPNPDNLPEVRHLNDIKSDNRLVNLAWGTRMDNINDAIKNGKLIGRNTARGENSAKSKLTEKQVLEIRCKVKNGTLRIMDLATEYNVSRSSILRIYKNKSWTHIP